MPKRLIDGERYPSYKERVLAVYPNAVCKRVPSSHGDSTVYVVFSSPEGTDGSRVLGYKGYAGSVQARFAWVHAFEHIEGREL